MLVYVLICFFTSLSAPFYFPIFLSFFPSFSVSLSPSIFIFFFLICLLPLFPLIPQFISSSYFLSLLLLSCIRIITGFLYISVSCSYFFCLSPLCLSFFLLLSSLYSHSSSFLFPFHSFSFFSCLLFILPLFLCFPISPFLSIFISLSLFLLYVSFSDLISLFLYPSLILFTFPSASLLCLRSSLPLAYSLCADPQCSLTCTKQTTNRVLYNYAPFPLTRRYRRML